MIKKSFQIRVFSVQNAWMRVESHSWEFLFKKMFCCGLQNLEEKSDYVSDALTSCRMKGRITFS